MTEKHRPSIKERVIIVGLAIAGFVITSLLFKEKKSRKEGVGIQPPVRYRIVKGGRRDAVISMEVLVDPKTTKQQALDLGCFLKEKYQSGNTRIDIGIFDDIQCAVGRVNKSIPAEVFLQHHLVQVTVDKNANQDDVEWRKR